MINDIFTLPLNVAIALDSVIREVLFPCIYQIFDRILSRPIGIMFFISVAISFIFVAIKFIRSVVWGF